MPIIEPLGASQPVNVSPNTQTAAQILARTQASQSAQPEAQVEKNDANAQEVNKVVPDKSDEERRFQAATKKERELFKRHQNLKQQENLLKQRYSKYENLDKRLSENKLQALAELGITYDELTNLVLNQGQQNLTPEQIAERKAEAITSQKLQEFEQRQQQANAVQTQRQYQDALKQIGKEVEHTATAENYPLVNALKSYDTVVNLIELTFHESGRIMPVEEAIQEVESYLEEQMLEVAKLPKISSKLQVVEKTQALPVTEQPKTITHRTTTAPAAAKPMTYAEKKARAIAVAKGEVPPSF